MNKDKSVYMLSMTKEEHHLIKERARKLNLSIKEFLLIAVYNLIENKSDKDNIGNAN